MGDIGKIIFIADGNIFVYILLYCSLNCITVLFYLLVKKEANKHKAKTNKQVSINDNENYNIEDIKIDKFLRKLEKKERIAAYIFFVLFFCFLFTVGLNLLNKIPERIVFEIYGVIILSSMYTVIPFFEYIKKIYLQRKTKLDLV
ncbi:MAG: hypothetical protein LBQ89_01055 [Treponema sp.]|jgi:Ca2+/Na+ antiporter|nr:hypothetical protein [Treponema sp.]